MEMKLPFGGFYYSEHDVAIDDAHEQLSMDDDGMQIDAVYSHLYNACNWKGVQKAYAKEYAEQFAKRFGLEIVYKDMESPREYNFTTDRIFVEIGYPEVLRLFSETDKAILDEQVKMQCTSRSGFVSLTPNDYDLWGELSTWDHNKLGILLDAWIESEHSDFKEYELMQDAQGNGKLDNWIFENMSQADVTKYDELRQEVTGEDGE